MSRHASKRRRYSPVHSSPEPEREGFASPSTRHIFARPSSSFADVSLSPTLKPCSYEIALNHDRDLARSLHPRAEVESQHGATRLVTWASTCGQDTVQTDRFDAIHLLSSLPTKQQEVQGGQMHDTGWSDLDSDAEDLFYMTDVEAASFSRRKARTRLEMQHTLRLNTLPPDPASPPSPPPVSSPIQDDAQLRVSPTQLELMQRLANSLSTSSNPSQLELKILANHSSDARFAFLRTSTHDNPSAAHLKRVWEQLKQSQRPTKNEVTAPTIPTSLVAYDDTDSDDEAPISPPAPVDPHPATDHDTAEAEKKLKQAQRLARAKAWLKTRQAHAHHQSQPQS